MKNNKILKTAIFVVLAAAVSVISVSAQGGFDYDQYKTKTLAEIVEINSDLTSADLTLSKEKAPADNPYLVAYSNILHSAVRVRFMNKSRPISAERKEILTIWKTSLKIGERIVPLYENEYLFKECDKEYWIPVQKQVAEFFPKELKEGNMVTLYLVRVGGRKFEGTNNWDWLFISTEFDK